MSDNREKDIADVRTAKRQSPWCVIFGREIRAYFTSPIAYIVCALFLVFSGFLFFSTFFLAGRAELRAFFETLPLVFSFFIPALTMRVFSEENRSGSMETLMTLPVTDMDVVVGKYLASFVSSLTLLVPTLFYVITCRVFGRPDAGPLAGGYLGAVFLAAAFSSIGVFASSVTKNQILAFFIGFAVCIVLSLINIFGALLPGILVSFTTFISATSHFNSIARGIIDTRDVIYFVSVTALFFVLTVSAVRNARRG